MMRFYKVTGLPNTIIAMHSRDLLLSWFDQVGLQMHLQKEYFG